MSTTRGFMEYVIDQASGAGDIRTRAMFGEYALYCNEVVVALICNDAVYMKINENTTQFLGDDYIKGKAYPGSKDFYEIQEDILEDKESFVMLITKCFEWLKNNNVK